VSLVADDVISGIEAVNSSSVNVQVTGQCATVQFDKGTQGVYVFILFDFISLVLTLFPHFAVSGGNIYMSQKMVEMDAQVISAKVDALNIHVPKKDGEFEEHPVPEQFVSKLKGGKVVTEQVDHSD